MAAVTTVSVVRRGEVGGSISIKDAQIFPAARPPPPLTSQWPELRTWPPSLLGAGPAPAALSGVKKGTGGLGALACISGPSGAPWGWSQHCGQRQSRTRSVSSSLSAHSCPEALACPSTDSRAREVSNSLTVGQLGWVFCYPERLQGLLPRCSF